MYGNNQYINNLERLRDRANDMINTYQPPVNNFINTGNVPNNLYELKKLNDGDEVENIAILNNSIFLGEDRLQIKKLDGTIEKYKIKKTYPRDKKDDKIDELTKKIEELEMRLNEPKSSSTDSESIETSTEQRKDDKLNAKSKSTKASK